MVTHLKATESVHVNVNTLSEHTNQREYGLDLLRIVSMLMIIVIHIFSYNPYSEMAAGFPDKLQALDFLNTITRTAVNCFAMLSGYLMIDRPTKYEKISALIFQTVFYSLSFTVLGKVTGQSTLTVTDFIRAIFPATTNLWWYYSCYFVLFFIIPYINRLINGMTEREFTTLFGTVVLFFSLRPTVTLLFVSDRMVTNGGFSVLYILALYIMGAYFKKSRLADKCKMSHAVIVYLLSFALTHIAPYCMNILNYKLSTEFSATSLGDDPSVNIMLMTVSTFVIFSKIRVPKCFHRILEKLSALAFSVYIIHEHPVTRNMFVSDKLTFIGEHSAIFIPLGVFGCAVVIYLLCCIVELLRLQLFKFTGMRKLEAYLCRILVKLNPYANEKRTSM